jgi:hypothetical protein
VAAGEVAAVVVVVVVAAKVVVASRPSSWTPSNDADGFL